MMPETSPLTAAVRCGACGIEFMVTADPPEPGRLSIFTVSCRECEARIALPFPVGIVRNMVRGSER